jgi:hypothetical protein
MALRGGESTAAHRCVKRAKSAMYCWITGEGERWRESHTDRMLEKIGPPAAAMGCRENGCPPECEGCRDSSHREVRGTEPRSGNTGRGSLASGRVPPSADGSARPGVPLAHAPRLTAPLQPPEARSRRRAHAEAVELLDRLSEQATGTDGGLGTSLLAAPGKRRAFSQEHPVPVRRAQPGRGHDGDASHGVSALCSHPQGNPGSAGANSMPPQHR